jgi:hypothetical protein
MDEIDWKLLPGGDTNQWDGQLGWFLSEVLEDRTLLSLPCIKDWKSAVDAIA